MKNFFQSDRIRPFIRRVYWAITPATHGRSRARIKDISVAVPFNFSVELKKPTPRVCVICHLYYDDLSTKISEALENIPFSFDLFISTDNEVKKKRILSDLSCRKNGSLEVRLAPNRGRDIGPKLITFADVYENYDLVLFIHGKKSALSSVGDRWLKTLVGGLVGSRATVQSILTIFENNPKIGIVATQHFEPIRPHIHWDHVFGIARKLAQRMGFKISSSNFIDMPSGSMFWARTQALSPLLDLKLKYEDFPVEKGQTRGTLHHAIERLFFFACEKAGFQWLKVADPKHYSDKNHIQFVNSPGELEQFVNTANFNLLNPIKN